MTTDEHMEAFAGVIGSKKAFMLGDFESTENISTVAAMKEIADYGTGHRESGLAAGREPKYYVESEDGQREPMEGFGGIFENPEDEEHPCPTCDGEGMVDFLQCPDCGGDGTHLAYQ